MKNLVIFASGSGSNAENIIRYFATKPDFCVKKIYCNVPGAYVLERARQLQVPACVFTREEFRNPDKLLRRLQDEGTDFIVLAGFLWLVPPCITAAYPNRIINIHPALLPAYGGKGMYGHHVHEAVLAAGEQQSGITIHYVNDRYDSGANNKAASPSIMSTTATTPATSSSKRPAPSSPTTPPTPSLPASTNWNTGISPGLSKKRY